MESCYWFSQTPGRLRSEYRQPSGYVMIEGPAWEERMGELTRTGVSLEEDLLKKFDELISNKGYQNRSEAIRDLIRERLITEDLDENKTVVGTLTFIYDHHRPNLTEKLVAAQHHAGGNVLAATHVHLDHHNCLEVIIMKGRGGDLKKLADGILSLRGVKHGQLVVTTTGKEFE